MDKRLTGRRGELLRLGLAARNWLIIQLDENSDFMSWKFDDTTRSAEEIATHVSWSLSAVCNHLSEELDVPLVTLSQEPGNDSLESEIQHSYRIFKELLNEMTDDMLDRWSKLPPPAKLREGSIETILRIIAGYHAIHHGGQIALILSRAKNWFK